MDSSDGYGANLKTMEEVRQILTIPPRSQVLGYSRLIEAEALAVLPPRSLAFLATQGGRREIETDSRRSTIYPAQYDPGASIFDHLEFALKHEGVNLAVLAAFFSKVDRAALTAYIRSRPTGQYARRAWFLFEWLMEQRLDLDDLKSVPYVPLVDPERFFTGLPNRSSRHAIDENFLGTRQFSPTVEKTDALRRSQSERLDEEARRLVAGYDEDTVKRAVNFLYTKETRSTWELEREKPNPQRGERFILALRHAAGLDQLSEAEFVKLQNIVVDTPYADRGYRNSQNYVGSGYVGRGVVEFVCPKPEDVGSMMSGLIACIDRMRASAIDPVVAAAIAGFGFVFVHPFRDGNGRLHRWLIHHVLARSGFTPPGMIFPVSAVMLARRAEYDEALERFSRPLGALIDYELGNDGALTVHGESARHYRYFDCTAMAEALYRWTAETVRKELKTELDFLVRFRAARAEMDEVVDMPDKEASLFIKLVVENAGRLSKAKRGRFPELSDDHIVRLEEIVRRNGLGEG